MEASLRAMLPEEQQASFLLEPMSPTGDGDGDGCAASAGCGAVCLFFCGGVGANQYSGSREVRQKRSRKCQAQQDASA